MNGAMLIAMSVVAMVRYLMNQLQALLIMRRLLDE